MTLQNGDICLVDGCSGIYYNGQITLSNLTVTNKEPDYVLRFDGEITSDPERISLPVLDFGAVGLYVGILQACLRFHGIRIDIDGVLGTQTLAALRTFRKDHYLEGDTVCDSQTWNYLLTE